MCVAVHVFVCVRGVRWSGAALQQLAVSLGGSCPSASNVGEQESGASYWVDCMPKTS